MTAAEIARALHGFRVGHWWRCRCPVHGSHQASPALQDGDYALIVNCWAGCSRGDILEALKRLGLFDGTFEPSKEFPDKHTRDYAERKLARARAIWERARDGRGSTIEHWFRVRGIDLPVPRTLRWARSCRHPTGGWWPVMIARVDNFDGELMGIRRIYLLPDGSGKAPVKPLERLALGPVAGGAVRLTTATSEHRLVGEGIETCLSAMEVAELSGWDAGDTSALKNLVLPPAIRIVRILADNDTNGAGQRAARIAAHRWLKEGREVRIAWPRPGCDFNDMAMGAANAAQ
jgi:putative DNA primase/helicase